MSEFLVETYLARGQSSSAAVWSAQISRAAQLVAAQGRQVELLHSIAVPAEETCFFLFAADSVDAVREAAARAGLTVERIAEATPGWQPAPGAITVEESHK